MKVVPPWQLLPLVLLSFKKISTYLTGRVAHDERVIFFPTCGSRWNDTHWKVPIHGWIFKPKESDVKRAAFRSVLRRILQIQHGSDEERIFHRRIHAFVVDNERWRRPTITLAGGSGSSNHHYDYRMTPSGKDGHFQTTFIVPEEQLLKVLAANGRVNHPKFPAVVPFSASSRGTGRSSSSHRRHDDGVGGADAVATSASTRYEGSVTLVPPHGITIRKLNGDNAAL
jgi:hypothetical protein